jgi:4-hydroxy-3-methylbut-2-en-1-yl diphosphate reductase
VTIVAALRLEAMAVGGTYIGMRARRPLPADRLVLAGVAGAVVPGLEPGDIVVADRVLLSPTLPPDPSDPADPVDPEDPADPAVPADAGRPGEAGFDGEVVLPGASDIARALRVAGLTVHLGPVGAADQVVTGAARAAWADRGALAVDMESAALARTGRLVAVVRAIVDTPVHPLVSFGTLPRGIAALRALRRAAPVLSAWAGGRGGPEVRERQAAQAEAPVTLPGEVENS